MMAVLILWSAHGDCGKLVVEDRGGLRAVARLRFGAGAILAAEALAHGGAVHGRFGAGCHRKARGECDEPGAGSARGCGKSRGSRCKNRGRVRRTRGPGWLHPAAWHCQHPPGEPAPREGHALRPVQKLHQIGRANV